MKKNLFIMLAIFLTLVFAASTSWVVRADDAVVPFKATYATTISSSPGDPGCNNLVINGTGNATHLGESTMDSNSTACFATLTQTGTLEFTAANGDKLYGSFSGKLAFSGPIVTFWGNYVMTDGTGRFDENTGAGTYSGTASLVTNKGTITFNGELNK
jgi:hypothetical protein